jgi:CheY-like chemotaxis protein
MTQLRRGTGLTDQQTEMVDMLERTGDALLSLIDDVLDFSKIEAGRLKLSPEPFDLRQMVDDVVVLLGSSARESALDLIVQFAPSLPCHVVGDRGRIRQVLLNLIGNAIKFTETGYISVEVDGRIDAGVLHLSASVCDTGIGIAEGKLATIFEKFEQADGSTTRIYGGTGLGLAISRDLVTLMGGTLTATSVLGTGSRFRMDIVLPIVANELSSKTGSDINPNIEGLKILVVDDLPPNLKVITTQLDRLGLRADAVGSAKAAVEHLVTATQSGEPYTLLITDYQMPDCDGLRLTQTLRRHDGFEALDIIVMSSVDDPSVRESFAAAKVNDYLFKPITLTNFDRMIMRAAARLSADAP